MMQQGYLSLSKASLEFIFDAQKNENETIFFKLKKHID